MKIDNPFDKALEAQKQMPESMRIAATHAVDTLDLAWKGVQAVFEKKATPELALMLLPILLQRADAERQQRLDEVASRTEDATKPSGRQRRPKKAE